MATSGEVSVLGAGEGSSEQRVDEGVNDLVLRLGRDLDINGEENGYKLAGVVFADELVRRSTVRKVLEKSWGKLGKIEFDVGDDNLIAISAKPERVAAKLIRESPWAVDGYHMMVRAWVPNQSILETNRSTLEFWVQAKGLTLQMLNEHNLDIIGREVGRVLQVEDPKDIFRSVLRLRVEVEYSKPLCGGFWIPREVGSESWVEVKYERLADFCYGCARLGHPIAVCRYGEIGEDGRVKMKFGNKLRAIKAYTRNQEWVNEQPEVLTGTRAAGTRRRAPSQNLGVRPMDTTEDLGLVYGSGHDAAYGADPSMGYGSDQRLFQDQRRERAHITYQADVTPDAFQQPDVTSDVIRPANGRAFWYRSTNGGVNVIRSGQNNGSHADIPAEVAQRLREEQRIRMDLQRESSGQQLNSSHEMRGRPLVRNMGWLTKYLEQGPRSQQVFVGPSSWQRRPQAQDVRGEEGGQRRLSPSFNGNRETRSPTPNMGTPVHNSGEIGEAQSEVNSRIPSETPRQTPPSQVNPATNENEFVNDIILTARDELANDQWSPPRNPAINVSEFDNDIVHTARQELVNDELSPPRNAQLQIAPHWGESRKRSGQTYDSDIQEAQANKRSKGTNQSPGSSNEMGKKMRTFRRKGRKLMIGDSSGIRRTREDLMDVSDGNLIPQKDIEMVENSTGGGGWPSTATSSP